MLLPSCDLVKRRGERSCPSGFNFEKNFHHDWYSKWKTRNTKNHSDRQFVFSKDIAQQLRGGVSYLRLRDEVAFGGQVCRQFYNPGHLIERAQMVSRRGEH